MKKIELIEFLKGYSIFTIVIFHLFQVVPLPGILTKAILFGGAGVHLFILLSGIGLYLSFQNKPIGYFAFLKKRLSKIYVPYIIVVLISALIALMIPIYPTSIYALLGHVFLYKMFDSNIVGSYGYPLWFISTIIQFYFIFHLLVMLKKVTSNTWFFICGLLMSNCWSIIVVLLNKDDHGDKSWTIFFLQFIWEFMLGMIIADKINNKTFKVNIKTFYYLAASLLFIAIDALLVFKLGDVGKMFNDVPALFGYSLLAVFLYKLNIGFINKFFLFTGSISFPLYLVHFLVLQLVIYACHQLKIDVSIYSLVIVALLSYLLAYWYSKIVTKIFKLMPA